MQALAPALSLTEQLELALTEIDENFDQAEAHYRQTDDYQPLLDVYAAVAREMGAALLTGRIDRTMYRLVMQRANKRLHQFVVEFGA